MKLGDVPDGSVVYVYLDGDGEIVITPTGSRLLAHVVRRDKGGSVLLAWKVGEQAFHRALMWGERPDGKVPGFVRGYWVVGYTECELVGQPVSIGAAATPPVCCRKCGTFSPYSQPNRPNGTFICYSCRQGWLPAGW